MKEYIVKVYEDRTEWRNLEGELHRENGPAIEWRNDSKEYWINGKRHREDGPAVEHANGYKSYWVNDLLHNENGPACIWPNGDKKYWINSKELSEEEFLLRNKSCEGKTVTIDGIEYELKQKEVNYDT